MKQSLNRSTGTDSLVQCAGGWSQLGSDVLCSLNKIVELMEKMWGPHGMDAFVSVPSILWVIRRNASRDKYDGGK